MCVCVSACVCVCVCRVTETSVLAVRHYVLNVQMSLLSKPARPAVNKCSVQPQLPAQTEVNKLTRTCTHTHIVAEQV